MDNTETNRQKYREILFTTPGIEQYISGVILHEETIFQKCKDGTLLMDQLLERGIIAGVKVDKGLKQFSGGLNETVTQGLDDLDSRCRNFYEHGCRFTKWRSVFHVREVNGILETPTTKAIEVNVQDLARFAYISQMSGLVPIVEPEVLMDGDFSIDAATLATETVIAAVFKVPYFSFLPFTVAKNLSATLILGAKRLSRHT